MQSTSLRNYCEKNNLAFHLHVVENQIPNTFLVLESLIEKASNYDGIVMCSVSMLPNDPTARRSLVTRVLDQSCKLHFTFEHLVVSSLEHLADFEELVSLIDLSHNQQPLTHSLDCHHV